MDNGKGALQSGARRRFIKAFGLGLLAVCCLALGAVWLQNLRNDDLTIPTPVVPKDNAYDGFERAYGLLKPGQPASPYDMTGSPAQNYTFANFKTCAQNAAPALAEIHRDLGKPYLFPPERFPGSSIGATSHFRKLGRAAVGAAKYEELCGHPGRAADILLDGVEMGVMIPRGGGFVEGMIGMAIEVICEHPLESLLPELAPSELAHVAARLDRVDQKRVPYSDVVIEENDTMTAGMLAALTKAKREGGFSGLLASFLAGSVRSGLPAQQVYARKVAEEARRPYAGPSRVPQPQGLFAMGAVVKDALTSSRPKWVTQEAVFVLLRAETALYQYRAARGRFPATLADLSPLYLNPVPADPFGRSQPLRYRPTEGGRTFVLYSLGPGMVDRGGAPAKSLDGVDGNLVAGKMFRSTRIPKIAVPAFGRKR